MVAAAPLAGRFSSKSLDIYPLCPKHPCPIHWRSIDCHRSCNLVAANKLYWQFQTVQPVRVAATMQRHWIVRLCSNSRGWLFRWQRDLDAETIHRESVYPIRRLGFSALVIVCRRRNAPPSIQPNRTWEREDKREYEVISSSSWIRMTGQSIPMDEWVNLHIGTHWVHLAAMVLLWWSPPKNVECQIINWIASITVWNAIPSTGIHRIELHCPFPPWCGNQHLRDCDSHSLLSSRFLGCLAHRFSMSNMYWKDLCTDGMLDRGFLLLRNALEEKKQKIRPCLFLNGSILHTIQNAFTGCDDRTIGTQVIRHTFANLAWLENYWCEWNRLVRTAWPSTE